MEAEMEVKMEAEKVAETEMVVEADIELEMEMEQERMYTMNFMRPLEGRSLGVRRLRMDIRMDLRSENRHFRPFSSPWPLFESAFRIKLPPRCLSQDMNTFEKLSHARSIARVGHKKTV